MPAATTPDAQLRAAVGREPARPFLTHYDDLSGARVELSLTTFENWVAKTAGLLVDDLDVQPGDRVLLDVPLHWQSVVVLSACWACGAVADVRGLDAYRRGDVVVTGPGRAGEAASLPGAQLVALSLRPLGGPFPGALPPGAVDHGRDALGHPDRFAAPPLASDRPALVDRGNRTRSAADVVADAVELARAWRVGTGARLLTAAPLHGPGLAAALSVPLAVDGSAVLCVELDRARLADRVVAERVTATLVDGEVAVPVAR